MNKPKARINLKIKPCPFCGSAPDVIPWHGGRPTKMLIECIEPRCGPAPSVTGETFEAAVRQWNKRVKA